MADIYKSIPISEGVFLRVVVDDGGQFTRIMAHRSGTSVPITMSIDQIECLIRTLQSCLAKSKQNAGALEVAHDFTA